MPGTDCTGSFRVSVKNRSTSHLVFEAFEACDALSHFNIRRAVIDLAVPTISHEVYFHVEAFNAAGGKAAGLVPKVPAALARVLDLDVFHRVTGVGASAMQDSHL